MCMWNFISFLGFQWNLNVIAKKWFCNMFNQKAIHLCQKQITTRAWQMSYFVLVQYFTESTTCLNNNLRNRSLNWRFILYWHWALTNKATIFKNLDYFKFSSFSVFCSHVKLMRWKLYRYIGSFKNINSTLWSSDRFIHHIPRNM